MGVLIGGDGEERVSEAIEDAAEKKELEDEERKDILEEGVGVAGGEGRGAGQKGRKGGGEEGRGEGGEVRIDSREVSGCSEVDHNPHQYCQYI